MKSRGEVLDLFSGAGGFSFGFKEVGLKIRAAIEINSAATKSYKVNFPESIVIQEDIRNLGVKEVKELVGDVEVIIGGPPCEAFTGANPRRLKDPLERLYIDERGKLILEFIRFVGALKPKIFVMENVVSLMDREIKEAIKGEFSHLGYEEVYFNVLEASALGNPSRRKRVFISNIEIEEPKATKKVSTCDAIKDLPPPSPDFPNHEYQELPRKYMQKVTMLKQGQSLGWYKGYKRNIPIYKRLSCDDIAPTVMGNSRFIHPLEDRMLTVREQARLMSYPDHFIFIGNKDEQYNQVGESVPPILAKYIAEIVMERLKDI
jgi:DNA (cytosine-5)-methyltransferase 1